MQRSKYVPVSSSSLKLCEVALKNHYVNYGVFPVNLISGKVYVKVYGRVNGQRGAVNGGDEFFLFGTT